MARLKFRSPAALLLLVGLASQLGACGTAPKEAAPVALVALKAAPQAAAEPVAPVDPPLAAEAIKAVAPDLRTQAGDPKQPNDPADKLIPGDPINLVIVGSEAELVDAMAKAGWVHPAPITLGSVVKMGMSLIRSKADATAPVSNLYLFNRPQDLAWEANSPNVHERDHCRAWKSTLVDGDGRNVWLMAGTRDVGIEWDHRSHQPTHKIGPDIDAERETIVQSLQRAVPLKRVYQLPGIGDGHPFSGTNGGGDPFHTDGMLAVVEL